MTRLQLASFALDPQVFQLEQGYQNEFDDTDRDSAIHFIAEVPTSIATQYDPELQSGDYQAVAAGRIYQVLYQPGKDSKPNSPSYPLEMVFALGRICCLKAFRGHGLGRLILDKITSTAQRLGANKLVLDAQADKVAFYTKSGFSIIQVDGKDWCFEEEGNPHIGMQLVCETP